MAGVVWLAMSKAEILSELPKLTKDERYEIRVKLAEMDGGGWSIVAYASLTPQ
jgi:hypothetical protein